MVVRTSVRREEREGGRGGGREEREEYTNRLLWGLGNIRGRRGDKMEGYGRQSRMFHMEHQ